MRFLRNMLTIALVLSACVAYAKPQSEVFIYKGGPLSQDGIEVGGWGTGKAVESSERILTGSRSIKITTQGLYSGGRIEFAQPIPLFSDTPDKDLYMQLSLYFEDVQKTDPAAITNNKVYLDAYFIPKATKLRVVFVSDTGLMVSAEQPAGQLDEDDRWVRIAVPLAKLKLPEGVKEFKLSRLLIFTDVAGVLHLGEIKLMRDNTPIKADISGASVFGVNDKEFFLGAANGGVTTLKYSWDYDKNNGIQTESSGVIGGYTYNKEGDYTITLTVSDYDGLKEPAVATFDVSINGSD